MVAPGQLGDSQTHQRIFLDLSARYEEHCRTSGASELPAMCEAAARFRRERSLTTLIAFADLLETLELPVRAR